MLSPATAGLIFVQTAAWPIATASSRPAPECAIGPPRRPEAVRYFFLRCMKPLTAASTVGA
jgi:hypothetical protein